MTSIDVDIGGTFTDCYISRNQTSLAVKTLTTGYNLGVGFMRALRQGAEDLGLGVEDLLAETEVIRYSTTVAMNALIERRGPKLALITTEGFEDTIFVGKSAQWADGLSFGEIRNLARMQKPQPLISREIVVGVRERVDAVGRIVQPLDEEDFLKKLQYLVDNGVRGFVISLLWSFANPVHERRLREIIRREYPESYLGRMPVVLSSEVLPKRFEYPRTMTTILNAYLHQVMAEELRGISDELRDLGYHKTLLMVHNSGGMADLFRTAAVQTYNGGPVAGLVGGAFLGQKHGFQKVIVTDVGGTSFDLGIITDGSARAYAFEPRIDRWLVNISMLETVSIGAGGGSIAWLNPTLGNRLEVGPRSAGSMPGPACYDQGGEEPTVTDADVVLGYIDPDYYHGGKLLLNKDRAIRAIEQKIARPLSIKVEEAALLIKKVVDANMGNLIFKETVLRGFDPQEFMLFIYGGAGPTHACGYGFQAGINRMLTFPFAPIFCAYASSTMDVVHFFEQSKRLTLIAPGGKKYLEDYEAFNQVVRELQARALKEINLEGLPVDQVFFSLELEMKYGGVLHFFRALSPRLFLNGPDDVKALYQAFEEQYVKVYSPYAAYPEAGVDIDNFILRAAVPTSKPGLPEFPLAGATPAQDAYKGTRPAYWEEYQAFHDTPVYSLEALQAGNIVAGPAIVEAENTTIVLPPGTELYLDEHCCGEIRKI